jgi:hypothetical protein
MAASAIAISIGATNGGSHGPMAHTPIDMKTGVDGALALIEEVKATLMKMAAKEVNRAVLLVALPLLP